MKIFSVKEINEYMSTIIDNDYVLKKVYISGEITNYKKNSTDISFFSLKDESGILPCVMFGSDKKNGLDFEIANGQAVECLGSIVVYKKDGKYQYKITKMKKAGDGKLALEFEMLKQRLSEEGLFDFEIKKPIPKHPKTVGIVSSEQASGLKDFLSIAKNRDPYVQLILYSSRVQGKDAVDTVVRGIKKLDEMQTDIIIVCRGGGAIEELSVYNDERVVRAIYEAKTPIITGIGHEDDVFLSDYAADLRAPTPSGACVLAIPDVVTVIEALTAKEQRIRRGIQVKFERCNMLLENLRTSIESKNPVLRLRLNKEKLREIENRLKFSMDKKFEKYNNRLSVITARIHGLSPTAKLIGGFGYIESEAGPVTSVAMVKKEDTLNIIVNDGRIVTRVTDIMENE